MTLQPQNIVTQTVAGAGQFTGLAGAGLFDFNLTVGNIPANSRVVILSAAYHANASPGTQATWLFVPPSGLPATAQILLGRATAGLVGPSGDGDLVVCPGKIPRTGVIFWNLKLVTVGKTGDGTATVSYEIVSEDA